MKSSYVKQTPALIQSAFYLDLGAHPQPVPCIPGHLSALILPPQSSRKLYSLAHLSVLQLRKYLQVDSQGVSVLVACSPSFKRHSPELPAHVFCPVLQFLTACPAGNSNWVKTESVRPEFLTTRPHFSLTVRGIYSLCSSWEQLFCFPPTIF